MKRILLTLAILLTPLTAHAQFGAGPFGSLSDGLDEPLSLTDIITFFSDPSPVTDTAGDCAFDSNAWASGRGALQCYDGTATTYLIGALASDSPNDGQVIKWNTGGTLTWENDNNTAGITIADTLVGYSDGANNLVGDADLTWNKTTNILTAAGGFTSGASANPTITFKDSNAADGDVNASVDVNCTDTGSGTEDCDMTFKQQIAGTLTAFMTADADGHITLGSNRQLTISGAFNGEDAYFRHNDSYSFEGVSTEASGGSGGYGMYLYSDDDAAVVTDDRLGFFKFGGSEDATDIDTGAQIAAYSEGTWSTTSHPTNIQFLTTPSGSTTEVQRAIIRAGGGVIYYPPSTQTIADTNTITDDACGGIKPISSAGSVTTNTTNTFTAASSANRGCCMDVVNVGANTINLDENASFQAASDPVALGQYDTVRVCNDSSIWYMIGAVGNN